MGIFTQLKSWLLGDTTQEPTISEHQDMEEFRQEMEQYDWQAELEEIDTWDNSHLDPDPESLIDR